MGAVLSHVPLSKSEVGFAGASIELGLRPSLRIDPNPMLHPGRLHRSPDRASSKFKTRIQQRRESSRYTFIHGS